MPAKKKISLARPKKGSTAETEILAAEDEGQIAVLSGTPGGRKSERRRISRTGGELSGCSVPRCGSGLLRDPEIGSAATEGAPSNDRRL